MFFLNKCTEYLLDIFFPRRCLKCNKITTNKYFCEGCKDAVAYIKVKTCKKCGLPLKHCACKWNFYYFDEITHFFNVYKTLEGKETVVTEVLGREAAEQIIQESIDMYEKLFRL